MKAIQNLYWEKFFSRNGNRNKGSDLLKKISSIVKCLCELL